MFFRKKSEAQAAKPSQSQSISGTQINNSQVQMTQAGGNATVSQSGNLAAAQTGLTGMEVVALLSELEAAIKSARLPAAQETKALNYMQSAKQEAQEAEPDKDLVAKNLKRVGDALEGVDKATDAGKNLWEKGVAVFEAISPWLGPAAGLLGLL